MFTIRDAVLSDADALAKIHIDTWRSTYLNIIPSEILESLSFSQDSDYWADILSEEERSCKFLVAEEYTQGVIGFSVCGVNRDDMVDFASEIYTIYILETYQRHGVGYALFEKSREWAISQNMNSMVVWVLKDNPYQRFYEKLGGKLVAERMISIGKTELPEVAYGWNNIKHKND